jgi:hypothetical protein
MAGADLIATARATKVLRLVDVLARQPNGDDPDVVAQMPEIGWTLAAELAGVRPPSQQTRNAVVHVLRQRRKDPFDGFPRGA